MNDYIEMMEHTLSEWMKEYPIEWIEQAYKDTVGEPEPKTKIEESNFSREQYVLDIDTAWKCGYEAGKKENSPINICPHCGEYIGEEE